MGMVSMMETFLEYYRVFFLVVGSDLCLIRQIRCPSESQEGH